MGEPVKGKSEAGRRREQRAHATRQRIMDAALGLFTANGYVATTVEAIAFEARVAPATVYQAFGTKHALLAKTLDIGVAGDHEPVALLDQTWVTRARAEPDPSRRLSIVVRHAAQVAARTAAIKNVIRDAAATDPQARELLRIDTERRFRTQQTLVEVIIDEDSLRDGVPPEQATALFFALVNSDSYQLLVEQLGWSTQKWERWLTGLLQRELLGDNPRPL